MNRLFKRGLAMMMALVAATGVFAQAPQQMPELPVDSAVRIGVLPNGLTYYIRHNETPKGQADFYIAQKVGSILEEDSQRGLAHFLEHMCFNGTENFPGKGIINWLESIGVKFGYNLNAYTGVDETVYNISSVPVARQSVQDSCLLILHDWANALTLAQEEIDAERGVIHEEWRRSMVGQMRIMEELLPKIYPNSKYGERLPIGIMEVVDNFPRQALVDYYHTWYRPDQQGIIVVGDIDPDYIEGKIKEMFTPIKMPENPKERVYLPVEDNDGTIYAIGKDAEMTAPVALIFFKTDEMLPREMRNTQAFFPVKYMTGIVAAMLNARLSDIANTPDSPFAQASIDIDDFFLAKTKDALSLQVVGKGGDITPAVEAAYRELLRASKGGFTAGEFERANAELRSRYQQLFDSRNNTPNESYSKEYVRAFIDNDPIPGIEVEKQMMDLFSQMLPLEQVNTLLPQLVSDENRVVLLMLPDAEGFTIPTEQQLASMLETVEEEDLEPYKDTMREDPLIPNLPAPGSIKSQKTVEKWGATEFTLSNGLKVVVKPTTFKDNEIKFLAVANGGYSQLPDDQANTVIFMPYAMMKHGLGDYSNSDLNKYLQGKQAQVNFSIGEYTRDMSGETTVQDLPALMELIYANFTEFNVTADEFAAAQNMFKGILANQESTPDYAFGKLIKSTLTPAAAEQAISTAAIDAADRDATVSIVRQMLADASDYTFFFVGNIDLDTFKPLMEQYLATLPVGGSTVKFAVNPAFELRKGQNNVTESMAMSTPQTWVFYALAGNMPYTPANKMMASMASQILSKRLLDKIREEMGATYSIGAVGDMSRLGDMNVTFQIPFPMKPEMREEALAAIDKMIVEMGQNITPDELNPIKEFMVKTATTNLEENSAWIGNMGGEARNGVDIFNGQADVINAITPADVMKFWNDVLAQGNRSLILLNPAE